MIVTLRRLAKADKLDTLLWEKDNNVYIKDKDKTGLFCEKSKLEENLTTYIFNKNLKEIGTILIEEENIDAYFSNVNTPRKPKLK